MPCIARRQAGAAAARIGRRGEQLWKSDGAGRDAAARGRHIPGCPDTCLTPKVAAYSRRRMSRRIAIVEDEPAIRANYADALRRHGYEVTAYASRAGRARGVPHAAARSRARRHRPGRRRRRRLRADARAARAVGRPCRSSSCRRATPTSTSSRDCGWAPTTTSPRTRACRTSRRASRRSSGAATCSTAPPATEDIVERGPLALDVEAPDRAVAAAGASTSR